jgi:ubiquinone/menaquinone biosynthesis C-methylase UbiE
MRMKGPSSDVLSLWDQSADGWQHNEGLVRSWLAEVTEQMLDVAGIGGGMAVLDVAAGAGGQTLDIARRVGPGGKVLATDISPEMIALTRQQMRLHGIEHVQCRVTDAQSINLESISGIAQNCFDAAICRLGLMFCAAPLQALRGIRNCLAPEGRFGALVFSNPLANPCIRIMIGSVHRHLGTTPLDPFTPGSLLSLGRPGLMAELLRQAGFSAIEVRPVQASFRVARCEDYVDFVRTSGAPIIGLLKSMDEHERERVWDDITEQLRQFSSAQGWAGPNELLLCSGTAA